MFCAIITFNFLPSNTRTFCTISVPLSQRRQQILRQQNPCSASTSLSIQGTILEPRPPFQPDLEFGVSCSKPSTQLWGQKGFTQHGEIGLGRVLVQLRAGHARVFTLVLLSHTKDRQTILFLLHPSRKQHPKTLPQTYLGSRVEGWMFPDKIQLETQPEQENVSGLEVLSAKDVLAYSGKDHFLRNHAL